ncbi:hypothetical protein BCON_1072g00020 [Botryotinia convoluta]|uniref:Uncharacterized protein n=1 Tax=Botryotinia convoluta TaxID=54673 RepID=A0A4Z1H595_9HELO|nr:hypothetical protein BCON_1072g00020 [Botryotinia convoluta]
MPKPISRSLKRTSLALSPVIARNHIPLRCVPAKAKVLSVPQTRQKSFSSIPKRDMSSSSTKVNNVLKDKPFEPNTMMEIVDLLNSADIPSILWGNSMLDIYGVPTIDLDMSFLVERKLIEKARELLILAGLVECKSRACHDRAPDATSPKTLPNGHVHFHFGGGTKEHPGPTIQLHIRDERIWTLPFKDDNISYTDDSIIMASDNHLRPPNWGTPAANNPKYGRCRHYDGSPVRILTPECYADALVLLMVRDRNTMAVIRWATQINYLMHYKLFNPKKVRSATKNFMTFRPQVSSVDNLKEATSALKDTAEKGKLFAKWAK